MVSPPEIWQLIEALRWARFRLTYRALEKIVFPEYKGSTFRGPFGHAFRRLVCTRSEFPSCVKCPLNQVCPYAVVFESSPPPESPIMKDFSDSPRPFIIEPDLEPKTDFTPGESFFFDLLIFGKALDLFPYFVLAFRDLTSEGIGKTRGKALLEKVELIQNGVAETIYLEKEGLLRSNFEFQTGKSLQPKAENLISRKNFNLTLKFQTMTRLVYKGHLVDVPHFHIFFRNLIRRISALLFLYHGFHVRIDFASLISEAERVNLIRNLAVWMEWSRYSRRQQEKMYMGGLLGDACFDFEGVNFEIFLPFLAAGEVTHVGKGTVFGLGKYEISP